MKNNTASSSARQQAIRLVEQINYHLATARSIKPASQTERELLDQFQAKRLAFRAAVAAYDDLNGWPLLDECRLLGIDIGKALHEGRIAIEGAAL